MWDFREHRIKFENGEWLELRQEDESRRVRRIYVSEDTLLPPSQQTEVNVRISHRTPRDRAFVGLIENNEVCSLSHVYSARSLLPAKFSDIKVPVLNAEKRSQVITKGTELGVLQAAEVVDEFQGTEVENEPLIKDEQMVDEELSSPENEAIEKMMDNLPSELNDEQRSKVRALLTQHRTIISTGEHDIGRTHLVEHRIDTGEHRPIRQPLRRHPFQHLEWIDDEVAKMQEHGIVEPAASPWASNVVLVKKKDGSLRFCIDYRRLNSVTYKDSYPLPLIDNCLNALSGSSWYTTLDLRSGYYNIPIAEEDRDKSAFVTRRGCFRFTVMPFGLTCAPSVFQRLMDIVLCGLSYLTCLVYLDDVIIFGRSFDEQLERLGEVFGRFRKANLKLKPSKCLLCQRSVEFLGHVVSEDGIAMQDEKISAIRDWPLCKNLTEVRAFMGLSGYYRRFVKDFSLVASPLYDLMKKGVEFVWTKECQEAFDELKRRLVTGPVLALPTNEGLYVLDKDASDFGLGAVLSQQQPEGERVIAYASRTMSKAEQKYETTRKELLAVVNGLKRFRQYLFGRHFVIRVDHAALSWLRRTAEPMPQLARWLTFIEQFDYEVVHRPGAKHGNADGLSRRPPERMETNAEVCKIQVDEGDTSDLVGEGLRQRQQADVELEPIVNFRLTSDEVPNNEELQTESELTKKLVTKWNELEVRNGLVYRRNNSTKKGEPNFLQLLLPRMDVDEALRQCHAGVVAGHFGIRKTLDQIRRRFYWPSWKEDTKRFCRRCPECTEYHRGKLAKQGALKPVLPGAPYERWYIDLTGPHPRTERGHLWILTCMDSFTKWTEAFPLRNKEAETVAKVLVEQVFTRFGTPLSILSDQGKEVDGRIMNEVCRFFGIEKLRTTPYKPSTNQVERFHRTMNSVLAKTVAEHQKDWDIRLPFVMAAYRASRHDATGYSPNFLVLGRQARAPPDIIYGSPNEEQDETYDSFVERIRERSVTSFAEVRNNLRRSAERNKRYYDLGLKPKRFKVGQWVLYFNPRKLRGKQMKWIRQYEGPFLVVKVPSSVTAVIQRSAKAKPKTVHIDKLKEYVGKSPKKWIEAGSSSVDEAPPLVGAPFDGGVSSPTVAIRENELSEVIRPLPVDKTNECSSDERLENTEIGLVDEECSSPEAVVRAEEVQLGLDEAQFVNSDDVLAELMRPRLDEVQYVGSEVSEGEVRLGLDEAQLENPSDVDLVDEVSSLVGAPFDDERSSPTVFGEEVRQQLDEVQSENSPEVVCFRPTGMPVETKLSEVVRFRPDVLTEETKPLLSDNVSDEADLAEKSLSECLLDEAKSSDDNVSNGANQIVGDGVYEADEVFERRRPARQRKRPSKYEDFETQFAIRRMRASRRKFIEFSPSYDSSRANARGSIQHSSKFENCQVADDENCLYSFTSACEQTLVSVDEKSFPSPEIRTMVRSCERSPLQYLRTMVRSRKRSSPSQICSNNDESAAVPEAKKTKSKLYAKRR